MLNLGLKIIKNKIFIYLLGLIIGVTVSMIAFDIYIASNQETNEQFMQKNIEKYGKINNQISVNKFYLIAGLLLSEDNQDLIKDKIENNQLNKNTVKNYYELNIKPIYINNISNVLSNLKVKNNNLISSKLNSFKNKGIKKIQSMIVNIENMISNKIIEYRLQIEAKINFLKNKYDLNSDQIIEIIKAQISIKLPQFDNPFVDVDDDYHFGTISINGVDVDLSFLNFIDINIDLETTVYDDNQTPLKLSDDTLIINNIYFKLESQTGLGFDLVKKQIKIEGSKCLFIYQSLGVINENI